MMNQLKGDPRHALESKVEELCRLRQKHAGSLTRLWTEVTEEALRRLDAGEDIGVFGVPEDLVTDEFHRLVKRLGMADELSGMKLLWTC